MKTDLIKARAHIINARPLLRRHFRKHGWPCFYEDIDYLVKAIDDCLESLKRGEILPR